MKKYLLYLALISYMIAGAQESFETVNYVSVQPPDVYEFGKLHYKPINEYTGKALVQIPLFEFEFGDMKIPISLSYDTSGIQINQVASRVGMNWSLNAGGKIIKVVNGVDDFHNTLSGTLGYMANATPETPAFYTGDSPDNFLAIAPGLNANFITIPQNHYFSNIPVESVDISSGGNLASFSFGFWSSNLTLSDHFSAGYVSDLIKAKVINPQGIVYEFNKPNGIAISRYKVEYDDDGNGSGVVAGSINSDIFIGSYNLTSMYDPKTKNIINFNYSYTLPVSDIIQEHTAYLSEEGELDYDIVQNANYLSTQSLNSITFPKGEIIFYYNLDRLDYENVPDTKALTRILVKNNKGYTVKDIRFSYTYKNSLENCSETQCKRLFLDKIYFCSNTNPDNLKIAYQFEYNDIPLPKRGSYSQDFTGFYNGGSLIDPLGIYVPYQYHYLNQGQNSFIPFPVSNNNYVPLWGTYSAEVSPSFVKAGVLQKITNQMGGVTELTYEPNRFMFLGEEILGGGLRIKKQVLKDYTGSVERSISYEYLKEDGTTSGSIVSIPLFADYDFEPNGELRVMMKRVRPLKLTQGSYVGYSRVKITENNNGSIIKEYTSPEEFPNTQPLISYINFDDTYVNMQNILEKKVNNGCFPNFVNDKDFLRGKLKNEYFKNELNETVKEINYVYNADYFMQPMSNIEQLQFMDELDDGWSTPQFPGVIAFGVIYATRNLLTLKITKEHLPEGIVSKTEKFIYDLNLPLLRAKTLSSSLGGTHTESRIEYKYPSDFSTTIMTDLLNQNRISEVIQTENFIDDVKTSKTLINYDYFSTPLVGGSPLILPSTFLKANLGEIYYPVGRILKYDEHGNPEEIKKENDDSIILLYQYPNTKPIAVIEGLDVTYDQLHDQMNVLPGLSISASFSYLSNSQLKTKIENLRLLHPNAMINSYIYNPLFGLTNSTDARNKNLYYHFDEFGRLSQINDDDDITPIKSFNYNLR